MHIEMKEYILCASIHFDDGIKHDHQPKNIETGFVVCGRRHHNCYMTLKSIGDVIGFEHAIKTMINGIENKRDGQGFLTNLDRHVDRKEGYLIAKKAGQLLHNLHDATNPILISEDLY
jgi:hypothetical protein